MTWGQLVAAALLTVSDVRCVYDKGRKFNCSVQATRTRDEGESTLMEARLIAIIAVCDENTCTWWRAG